MAKKIMRFDKLKLMSMDEVAAWLDRHGQFDGSPWSEWFDDTYCENCEPIMCHHKGSELVFPCAWCEIEGKCKFFQDMDEVPDNKEIIKMWLEIEV